jgi:hypothetical protein
MTDAADTLRATDTVLVVDRPSADVPESLAARALAKTPPA